MSYFDLLMSFMIMVNIAFASTSFWTGISVGANRHLLILPRRMGIFASVAASFGFVCLISMWWLDAGWRLMPEIEAFCWMINHIVAFIALNLYHREVLRSLGFHTFGESRGNAVAAFQRGFPHGSLRSV